MSPCGGLVRLPQGSSTVSSGFGGLCQHIASKTDLLGAFRAPKADLFASSNVPLVFQVPFQLQLVHVVLVASWRSGILFSAATGVEGDSRALAPAAGPWV